VILRVALQPSATGGFYADLRNIFNSSPPWVALILALIFFNIYEFTDLGKRFKMMIGWRSALLIGALCGLLGDRILMALKAFVGT
jgi:hypothetical protein